MKPALVILLVLAACGDDEGLRPDASVDARPSDAAAPDADLSQAACQVAAASPGGVGTPLPAEARPPVCNVICNYLIGCGVAFPTCQDSCVTQAATRRADAVCTVAGCLRCPASDKDSPCRRLVAPRASHGDFEGQCQLARQACGATASEITATCDATSLTSALKLLGDDAMAAAVACLARPCAEQRACVAALLGSEPRPF